MGSLIAQDLSGTFAVAANEIEVVEWRTPAFKAFILPPAANGRKRWRVGGGVGPVHYRSDGDPWGNALYDEIELTLQPNILSGEDRWRMERCGYQVRLFPSRLGLPYVAEYRRAEAVLRMAPLALLWENDAGQQQVIRKPIGGLKTGKHEGYGVMWPGVFGSGTSFGYDFQPDQFRKVVRIDKRTDLPAPTIGTRGLRLTVAMALTWEGAVPENFAKGVMPSDLRDNDLKTLPTERLLDPNPFPSVHADAREAYWWQQSRAWDSSEEQKSWDVKWRLERRGAQIVALFGLSAEALNEATYPLYLDTVMAEQQVGATDDDAREFGTSYPGTGNYSDTGTSGNLGALAGGTYYCRGERFLPPLPASCTIDSATLTLKCSAGTTRDLYAEVFGEDNADAAAFNATTRAPGTHVWGLRDASASANWTETATFVTGDWYESSAIATVVQKRVDAVGWASGQGLVFLLVHGGAQPPGANQYIAFDTWNKSGNVSGAKFNCTYTEAAGTLYGGGDIAAAAVLSAAGVRRAFGSADVEAAIAVVAEGVRRTFGAADIAAAADVVATGHRRAFGAGDIEARVLLSWAEAEFARAYGSLVHAAAAGSLAHDQAEAGLHHDAARGSLHD